MNNSNPLNLPRFFRQISGMNYVVVKLNDVFPEYYPGSDIDIFTSDVEKLSRKILQTSKEFITDDTSFSVTNVSENHLHLDYMYKGQIDFRFDIYGAMPLYKKLNIKDYLLHSIIDRKKKIIIEDENEAPCTVFTPDPIDDLLIRYFEYLEYYEERPEKIKHLDYIYETIKDWDDNKRDILFDRLHLYTDIPILKSDSGESYFFNKYFSSLKFYYSKFKRHGVTDIVKKVWEKGKN